MAHLGIQKAFPGRETVSSHLGGRVGGVADTGNSKKSNAAADPDIVLLKRLYDATMIEPYVLLSAPDREIAADCAAYREQHRDQLEQCLSEFIVSPIPAKP